MSKFSLEEQADVAWKWWRSLQPLETKDGAKIPGDRAALARLRRSSSSLEAATEPATARLFKELGLMKTEQNICRTAVLAAVLAHVREPNPSQRIAEAIGAPAGADANEALVKPNRFKHLVSARGDEEILIAFRRVVAMLDRKANVKDLSKLILSWTDDEFGDKARTRFAFDYHGAGFAAPDEPTLPAAHSITEKV